MRVWRAEYKERRLIRLRRFYSGLFCLLPLPFRN